MNKIRTAIVTIALAGALAACGSADDGGSDGIASLGTATTTPGDESPPPTSADPEEAMLAYTECMRDEGIDMPDPQFVGEGGGATGGVIAITADDAEGGSGGPRIDVDSEQFQAAQEKCGPIMDEAIGSIEVDPEQQAEMREQMLEYAQCMRDNGIDFPDPEFGSNGQVSISMGSDDGEPPTEAEQQAMQEASEACATDGAMPMMPASPVGGKDD